MTTDPKDAEIARLRMALADTEALEMQHGADIERLTAERDAALAQVAGAFEAAAYEVRGSNPGQMFVDVADDVLALTPADALAALSRRDAQMRAEGMRIAAEIAEDVPGDGENPWSWPDRIRAAILAAAEKEARR